MRLYCISSFRLSHQTHRVSLSHISVTIITLSITYLMHIIAVALIKYVAILLLPLKHITGLNMYKLAKNTTT